MDLSRYSVLVDDLQSLQEEARTEARFAVNRILIDVYWQIGERLAAEKLTSGKGRKAVLMRISGDISLDYSQLVRCIKFYAVFPEKSPTATHRFVSWNHYKTLMAIQDERERHFYIHLIEEDRLSVRKLIQVVRADAFGASQRALPDVAEEERTQGRLPHKEVKLHLYPAMLEKVVDGDTLIFFVDLGFDVWRRQRVRLRGIDAPEMKTDEGDAAKKFVEEQVRGIYRFVIQTFKVDLYGRFVCDVFYRSGEGDRETIAREGNFLNQEILNAGHAQIVNGGR